MVTQRSRPTLVVGEVVAGSHRWGEQGWPTDAGPLGDHVGVSHTLLDLPLAFPVADKLVRLIWFVLTVAESIIGLRVLFKALASREEGFVRFVYAVSVPLVAPFRPIVADQQVGKDGRRMVEVSSLIAMLLLFLGAYLLVTLIDIIVG